MATSPGVGIGPVVQLTEGTAREGVRGVVVARDLSPAEVVGLDDEAVAALVTAAGAPLSHAAIVARARGIPAVTGLGTEVLDIASGTVALVDGEAGTVRCEPTPAEVEEARAREADARRERDEARRHAADPAVTGDGVSVPVFANVGSREDAELAVAEGADGVGMLRTEFAFLDRRDPPSEDEQYEAYQGVVAVVGDRPLIVRTLDLGADIPAWDAPPEPNPALGNRGIRFCLAVPDLLHDQLRAVARLATIRPVQLMFPMVTTVNELRRARARLDEVTATMVEPVRLEVGITVEVPAAALLAAAFAPIVDFFAIGTNDLTQYTLAADRANAAVAGIADGLHPAVLRLIRQVTAAAKRHGRPVEVVGELASDRLGVPILLGLGVTGFSVRPNAVAAVKQLVRATALDRAERLAADALGAESAEEVRRRAAQFWSGRQTSNVPPVRQ